MTDDEINVRVDHILALPEEEQVMTIRALVDALPPERQEVVREVMRAMLEST